MKSAIFFTFVALFARLSFAIPPGCLLHAVNTQDEPSDLSAVCGDGAVDVQQAIADNCGNFEETAQQAFIDTCSSAGTSVAAYTATETGSSATRTGSTATVTSARSSGSASGTGSSVQSTAGANVDYRQAALGPMAAAAVALVGAVAAL